MNSKDIGYYSNLPTHSSEVIMNFHLPEKIIHHLQFCPKNIHNSWLVIKSEKQTQRCAEHKREMKNDDIDHKKILLNYSWGNFSENKWGNKQIQLKIFFSFARNELNCVRSFNKKMRNILVNKNQQFLNSRKHSTASVEIPFQHFSALSTFFHPFSNNWVSK